MQLPTSLTLSAQAQADADNVHKLKVPFGLMVTAVSLSPLSFTGTPTGFSIDLNVEGVERLAGLAANTAGTPVTWKSRHHQGADEVIRVPQDGVLAVDVNLVGGAAPTVTYDLVLWVVPGTV